MSYIRRRLMGSCLIDSHCHLQLDRLWSCVDEVVARAVERNVGKISVCGVCPGEDWDRVAELCRRFPETIVPSFGLHPWWIHEFLGGAAGAELEVRRDFLVQQLGEVLQRNPRAHVGECGLDKACLARREWRGSERNGPLLQEAVLMDHLKVARTYGRTISLHCVKAWAAMQKLLCGFAEEESGVGRGVRAVLLHSCNRMPADVASRLLASALGPRMVFSFSAVQLPPAAELQLSQRMACVPTDLSVPAQILEAQFAALEEVLLAEDGAALRSLREYQLIRGAKGTLRVPADQVLLESDAPDQTPRVLVSAGAAGGFTAASNEPANVVFVYKILSLIYDIDFDEFVLKVHETAMKTFGDNN